MFHLARVRVWQTAVASTPEASAPGSLSLSLSLCSLGVWSNVTSWGNTQHAVMSVLLPAECLRFTSVTVCVCVCVCIILCSIFFYLHPRSRTESIWCSVICLVSIFCIIFLNIFIGIYFYCTTFYIYILYNTVLAKIIKGLVFSPAKNGFKWVISIFCCSEETEQTETD